MNWIEHRALYDLYKIGKVKINKTITESSEIGFMFNTLHLMEQNGNYLVSTDGFNTVYERKFKINYLEYLQFLKDCSILKPQTRFDEKDIRILMSIKAKMDNGDLAELREQIIAFDESLKGVSLMFFRNEKYLLDKPGLVDALKTILQVAAFSNEKDQQYIYRLDVINPVSIVLCENLDFLTKPNKPRRYKIELWYAGGKNVNKLEYADHRNLPVYYSCDWDYDGLFIIYPLVRTFIPGIQLLNPTGPHKSIKETEHLSFWPAQFPADMELLFTPAQRERINLLMTEDCWIIEESNDLITMLNL